MGLTSERSFVCGYGVTKVYIYFSNRNISENIQFSMIVGWVVLIWNVNISENSVDYVYHLL